VLHIQFQFEYKMGAIRLRFLVEDPDVLLAEYRQRAVECTPNSVRDTRGGGANSPSTDLDHNAFAFYRDLRSAEKESVVKREAQIGSPQK
jgi:hypothetical protein